jgi:2Fe-2S ferredoxin
MPVIRFENNKKPPIEVSVNSNLMQVLLEANVPVSSSCHGEGVCAKCRIQVIDGMQNLSTENETELFLKQNNGIADPFRISCQVQVLGDVTIDTGYW